MPLSEMEGNEEFDYPSILVSLSESIAHGVQEEDPTVWYLACEIILKDGMLALNRSTEEVKADAGWTAAVIFIATELILAPDVMADQSDNDNRMNLRKILTGMNEDPALFGKIVEPLLYNDSISNVNRNSYANAAASDYTYKLINLIYKLHAKGTQASPEDIDNVDRLYYERSLMLWVEWHIIWTTPDETVQTCFINHVFRVGIPLMYNREILGDPWGKRFREHYCFMVKEFTGYNVPLPLVVQLWHDWKALLRTEAEAATQ